MRVYDGHATVELDRCNPEYYPMKHAVFDAPKYTIAGVALMVGITIVNYSIDNWNYLDEKSLMIYTVGAVLLFVG